MTKAEAALAASVLIILFREITKKHLEPFSLGTVSFLKNGYVSAFVNHLSCGLARK